MRASRPTSQLSLLLALLIALGAAFSGCAEVASESPEGASADSYEYPEEEPELVEVPDVVGSDGADGESATTDAGLVPVLAASSVDEDISEPRFDAAGCEIVEQDPGSFTEVDPESEVTLYLDCRQIDWENQDGDEWETYTAAFEEALQEGCRSYFSLSPDGSLYDGDEEYTVLDCVTASEPDADEYAPSDVPDDPESDGATLGFDAGCGMLLDTLGLANLYYGRDAYWPEDCMIAS